MDLNFEVEGPDTYQLVTGKDSSLVSSNAQATYFAKKLLLRTCCLER